LVIEEARGNDVNAIVTDTGFQPAEDDHIYLLHGVNYRGYVIAGSVTTHEDQGEYDDPSPLDP